MGGTVTLLHQFSDAQFVPFIVFEIKIIFTIVGVFDYVKYGDISFLCRTQALLTLKKKILWKKHGYVAFFVYLLFRSKLASILTHSAPQFHHFLLLIYSLRTAPPYSLS